MEDLKGKTFSCPLCREDKDVRVSKTGLPYVVCNSCGVQMFVRYEKGIERLREAVRGKGIFG